MRVAAMAPRGSASALASRLALACVGRPFDEARAQLPRGAAWWASTVWQARLRAGCDRVMPRALAARVAPRARARGRDHLRFHASRRVLDGQRGRGLLLVIERPC